MSLGSLNLSRGKIRSLATLTHVLFLPLLPFSTRDETINTLRFRRLCRSWNACAKFLTIELLLKKYVNRSSCCYHTFKASFPPIALLSPVLLEMAAEPKPKGAAADASSTPEERNAQEWKAEIQQGIKTMVESVRGFLLPLLSSHHH